MSDPKYLSINGKRILGKIPFDAEIRSTELQKEMPDLSTYKISMVISHELKAGFVTAERRRVGDDKYMVYQRFK